jgi:hypothetical protein
MRYHYVFHEEVNTAKYFMPELFKENYILQRQIVQPPLVLLNFDFI